MFDGFGFLCFVSTFYVNSYISQIQDISSMFSALWRFLQHVHVLSYSMVQSPSWETNWFAASQEIPRISWNPKVHYHTHKPPPPVPILGQPNPVHIPTSHLLEIHLNIIHPSTPGSPQWSISLQFPHQDPICPPSPHPYMPSPSHSSRFYHPHNIGWGVHVHICPYISNWSYNSFFCNLEILSHLNSPPPED